MTLAVDGEKVVVDNVDFGSAAQKAGLDWDQVILKVLQPVDVPSKYLIYIPAGALLAGLIWLQRRRRTDEEPEEAAAGA